MQELLDRLKSNHGLTDEQSHGVLNTIKDFIKEKFPMIESAIDNLFPQDSEGKGAKTKTGDTGSTDRPASKGGSFLDDVEGFA